MDEEFIPFAVQNFRENDEQVLITEAETPWLLDFAPAHSRTNTLQNLHCEIIHFCRLMSLTETEMKSRDNVLREIEAIAVKIFPGCHVKAFGSHISTVLTPMSDLDVAILDVDESLDDPLYSLGHAIKKANIASYIEVIGQAKIPIVKIDHIRSGVSVDMLCNNTDGLSTARLMKRFVREYPPLKPLTIVLKVFLAQRKLNETYTGGLGSYVLCNLVISFLQMRQKVMLSRYCTGDSDGPSRSLRMSWNLGSLLVDFFYLYGISFNYADVGISIRDGGSYFLKESREWGNASSRPGLLCIENPQQPDVDMGRGSYNMIKIRRAFEHAHQVLLVALDQPNTGNEVPSVLAHIIRSDDPMLASRARVVKKSATDRRSEGTHEFVRKHERGYESDTCSSSSNDDEDYSNLSEVISEVRTTTMARRSEGLVPRAAEEGYNLSGGSGKEGKLGGDDDECSSGATSSGSSTKNARMSKLPVKSGKQERKRKKISGGMPSNVSSAINAKNKETSKVLPRATKKNRKKKKQKTSIVAGT